MPAAFSLTPQYPAQHGLTRFPVMFLYKQRNPSSGPPVTPVLVSCSFARWSCERPPIQWELMPTSICFLLHLQSTSETPGSTECPVLLHELLSSQADCSSLPVFTLESCSAYWTPKVEAKCSFESSVDFQQDNPIRCYITSLW
jgi:hypothetical protein